MEDSIKYVKWMNERVLMYYRVTLEGTSKVV